MDDLVPVPEGTFPFQIGEKVALKEDHGTHPGMYGVITAMGIADSKLQFDVNVIDPTSSIAEDPPVVARLTLEEIQ